jgi:endonuclease/exonuclease/phosphatase family metal-dependent hydrolase
MTWNVRSLRDDRDAVVGVLVACRPDVLFVQEAPRRFRAQSKLAALAREAGLVVASGGRPAAGVALLTMLRMDVTASWSQLLSKTQGLHQRGLAMADLRLGGLEFSAASLHLGLRDTERERHAAEIEAILGSRSVMSVVAGDFNEASNGAAWQVLGRGRRDVGATLNEQTFPASRPRHRIDTILVPDSWSTTSISPLEIVDESDLLAATDHRPVLADVVG